jgi:hypothetical protein
VRGREREREREREGGKEREREQTNKELIDIKVSRGTFTLYFN